MGMKKDDVCLVWFRRDLRLDNNPALDFAIHSGQQVIVIYIENRKSSYQWSPGAASRWWCYESLRSLRDALAKQKLTLHLFCGNPVDTIQSLVKQTGVTTLCWNNLYDPEEVKLQNKVKNVIKDVEVKEFDSHCLFQPGSILNKQEKPYRVFTPFWKSARNIIEVSGVDISSFKKNKNVVEYKNNLKDEVSLDDLGLLDDFSWHRKLHNHWKPGEATAHDRLETFVESIVGGYDRSRDLPFIDGTSKLSPHLHFGEITPAQIIYRLQQYIFEQGDTASVERYMTEIGWREFAHHVLWHFPFTMDRPMNSRFEKLCNTGVPIIDAGMRQLWETGWMHNRVRMIVGSFLTKNMNTHWLHGAKWFWDTLVDADLANNTLGWQWVAGCGVDAAPYYRVFNPFTQQKRFDPDLTYIKRWVHEYNEPAYAKPVVDLSESRSEALSRYKLLTDSGGDT